MKFPETLKRVLIYCAAVGILQAVLFIPVPSIVSWAGTFRVATYNVENLFDLSHDGTEYPAYVPGARYGWDSDMLAIKAENLSRVIVDLNAQVLALQEVESIAALEYLQAVLREKGLDYPWAAVTEKDDTAVRCALLSTYPIVESRDIVVFGRQNRNILKATVEIDGTPLVLFVNHWRSRSAPESQRKRSAKALYNAVSELPPGTDYILLGDFNTNYNEFETITEDARLNDTGGRTGINHVLNTIHDGALVDTDILVQVDEKRLHYNLWLEVAEERRWSYLFFGQRRTLDHILLPAPLYGESGIAYVDNSFDKFDPHYLFKDDRIFRWQREDKGRGRHLGKGYSDHLPVYACFTTGGVASSADFAACRPESTAAPVFEPEKSRISPVESGAGDGL